MPYRNIFVSSPAKLSIRNRQLRIYTDTEYSIPIEDISCLLLESQQITLSTHTLSSLTEDGVAVFICNSKHLPCSVLLPKNNHSRQLRVLKIQLNQSKPFLKRLWQSIVIAKIRNQAICLKLLNNNSYNKLEQLSKTVTSGDTTNVEGVAAALYFKELFGKEFSRNENNIINSALNYGYAIIRGAIARTLTVYGFELLLGINHHSELNNFNLADDLIEPFRPLVELFVVRNLNEDVYELTPKIKHLLLNLLNVSICIKNELHSVGFSIELVVKSLVTSLSKKENNLLLPELIEIRQHEYE